MVGIGKPSYLGSKSQLDESGSPDESGVLRSPMPIRPLNPSQRKSSVRSPRESQFPEETAYTMVADFKGRLESVFPAEEPSSVRNFAERADLARKKTQIEAMKGKLLSNSPLFQKKSADGKDYATLTAELLCVKLDGIGSYEAANPILNQFFSVVEASLFNMWLKGQRFNHNLSPINDPQRKTTPWRAMSPTKGNQMQWDVLNPASRATDTLPLFKILIGLDL